MACEGAKAEQVRAARVATLSLSPNDSPSCLIFDAKETSLGKSTLKLVFGVGVDLKSWAVPESKVQGKVAGTALSLSTPTVGTIVLFPPLNKG
jgi:hypothetical protein